MAIFVPLLLLTVAIVSASASRIQYLLTHDIIGPEFYAFFDYENITDPTHGRVDYVDRWTAITQGLTVAGIDRFILRADDRTVLDPQGPGRRSVRLRSFERFKNMVLIVDLRHMPQGCGTWPAIWTFADPWPNGGEIDIVEGVNDQSPDSATLHTNAGCTMAANRSQTGTTSQTDCNALINGNAGCGVKLPTTNSYGPQFNENGGGWYAMERSESHIRVWFWPRNGDVPSDVRFGGGQIYPDEWGTPDAYFPATTCDIDSHFAAQWIIINLTFCGDWAGNTYSTSGCPGTCVDYVDKHPEAFSNAYFDIASLRIYQPLEERFSFHVA